MIKLGANSVLYGGHSLRTAMEHLALAGYDGVELSAIKGMCEHIDLDHYSREVAELRQLAQETGLELLAMEVASLDEARLRPAFAAAAELGIGVVNIGPGGKSDEAADLRHSIDLMARMAEVAADQGVVLCVKAHVCAAIYNTSTTLRAMAEIDSPGFGIDMDPSHIYRSGEDPVAALKAVVSRVRHVHIRDCPHRETSPGTPAQQTCGRGEIDLPGYLRVLVEAGWSGPVELEVIGAHQTPLHEVDIIAAESRGYLNAIRTSLTVDQA